MASVVHLVDEREPTSEVATGASFELLDDIRDWVFWRKFYQQMDMVIASVNFMEVPVRVHMLGFIEGFDQLAPDIVF